MCNTSRRITVQIISNKNSYSKLYLFTMYCYQLLQLKKEEKKKRKESKKQKKTDFRIKLPKKVSTSVETH